MRIHVGCVRAGVLLGLSGAVLACNAILGIDAASLEPTEDAGTEAQADAGPAGQPTCAEYCDVISRNCTGANAEYLTSDVCVAMCPAFEVSVTAADTADDTLGCRMFFANAAATTPDVSCRFAGPLGGGHCGSDPCQPFCSLDVQYCAPPNPVAYDGGASACEDACKTYPYLVVDAGDTTLDSTNTLNCRLWHLETAFSGGATTATFHCPHTGQVSMTCK